MTDPLLGAPWAVQAGDCRALLAALPDGCVDTVACSPPYWNLRDYAGDPQVWSGDPLCDHAWDAPKSNGNGARRANPADYGKQAYLPGDHAVTTNGGFCTRCNAWRGALGAEPTVALYVAHLVEIFTAVRRVLKPTGVLFLNLGDSYSNAGYSNHQGTNGTRKDAGGKPGWTATGALGDKQLLLVPFQVALALQAAGWVLRSAIPWVKRNAMPNSADDRPNSSTEYVFLFSKRPRYYFDMEAAKACLGLDRNWRDGDALILDVPTSANSEAHFATFPPALVTPMILAGSSQRGCCPNCGAPWQRVTERTPQYANIRQERDQPNGKQAQLDSSVWRPALVEDRGWQPTCACDAGDPIPALVLDPFVGSGTTGVVACQQSRRFLGFDLNRVYVEMARRRIGTADLTQAIPDKPGADLGPLFASLR